jgi:hypothetical protein
MNAMHTPVPWVALAAVAAMFVLPWLDARGLFDGPRTIRHRPRRHVCADCEAPWTPGHQCAGWHAVAVREPLVPLRPVEPPASGRVRVLLTRTDQPDQPALPARERQS